MASISFRWIYNALRWIYNFLASFIGDIFRQFFHSHLVNELDGSIMDASNDDEMEITSSSGSCRYDVFPSFGGVDVRKTFLSHLLKELDRRSINTFIDHGIERSRPIGPSLLSAIRGARISIVIFSKNYASSTWCLNELVEIHKCYKELDQMVIPVFYDVDPSDVRKQLGTFGKFFQETCKDKTEDVKQGWMRVLSEVASIAGEHLQNGSDEASMIEKIANDVSNKLVTTSNDFGDFVGLEDHLRAMELRLCLESEEARMVGIVGTSGIGKSTIGRALYSQLSSQFTHRAFGTYKNTNKDVIDMKLSWEKEFLSEILGQKDIKIERLGEVKQRLKHKKVLIVLDDVDDIELLTTLVGETEWFGPGSRIIVITQDRQLLRAHKIDIIYEVELPSEGLALQMICRSAFGKDSPPDDFGELAVEVAELAGNLPLGLSVLGSSLKGRDKDEWMKMMPRLRNDSDDKIEKTLRVGYDRLNKKDRELFLCIACFFNGFAVGYVKDLLEDDVGLTMLAEKSLILITPRETIEMHNLLEKLGRKIDFEESENNPGKRRFLTDLDFEDIQEVFTEKTGTETVLGIRFRTCNSEELLSSIDEKSFKGMRNLQYLSVNSWAGIDLPQCLVVLPRKLRLLQWDYCPLKSLPSNFKAEYLVDLTMQNSNLEKLWEGTQPLGSLKKMIMDGSIYLKEIPDLSNAINLEKLDLSKCGSLTLPIYLPRELRLLKWSRCPLKCLPSNFKLEYLVELTMVASKLEKLWEGTLPLGSLKKMNLSDSKYLKEFPDLSYAKNLEELYIFGCESLVIIPSSIRNAIKLRKLHMSDCTKLESFPTHLNLESLEYLNLRFCDNLRNFPQIKMKTLTSSLHGIKIEVLDCFWNKNLPGLDYLDCLMRCMPCEIRLEQIVRLKVKDNVLEKLWEGAKMLVSLQQMDITCEKLIEIPDLSKATSLEYLFLRRCKSLVTVPSTIRNLQKLRMLGIQECTRLEVLPTDVNLSSLEILDLSGCSSLRTFPLISSSIDTLHLQNTAIEEVPSCIENFTRLTVLMMFYCKRLKNISSNIFRLTSLKQVNLTECRGVNMALSDASVVATVEDHFSCIPLDERPYNPLDEFYIDIDRLPLHKEGYLFQNCFKVDRDARELILRSCFKPVALPGGEVPTYFQHRAYGDSLIVTLPQSSLSQEFLRFKACVVVDSLGEVGDWYPCLEVNVGFNGTQYRQPFFEDADLQLCKTDHLFSCSFKFQLTYLPSKLAFNDVEFKFYYSKRINECGVRILNASPYPDDSDGSSDSEEYNLQPGEKCDIEVETRRSKKRMPMTSRTYEEDIHLPCEQIVADTGLAALNLEFSLGHGDASSVSSYPCLEGGSLFVDSMITEEQDAIIPILYPEELSSW